jgi:hypothetical protein
MGTYKMALPDDAPVAVEPTTFQVPFTVASSESTVHIKVEGSDEEDALTVTASPTVQSGPTADPPATRAPTVAATATNANGSNATVESPEENRQHLTHFQSWGTPTARNKPSKFYPCDSSLANPS